MSSSRLIYCISLLRINIISKYITLILMKYEHCELNFTKNKIKSTSMFVSKLTFSKNDIKHFIAQFITSENLFLINVHYSALSFYTRTTY